MPQQKNSSIDAELYGSGLLGEALAPERGGALAERFLIPPFSVFNAREGLWQDRKRAWLALGIQSELGRGDNNATDANLTPGGRGKNSVYGSGGQREGFLNGEAGQNLPPAQTSVDEAILQDKRVLQDGAPGAAGGGAESALPAAAESMAPLTPTISAFDDDDELPIPPPLTGTPRAQAPAAPVPPPTRVAMVAPPDLGAVPNMCASRAVDYIDQFKAEHGALLASPALPAFDAAMWDWAAKSAVGMDVECFRNYFLVCFKRFSDGKRLAFEESSRSTLDRDALRRVVTENRIVTFNGAAYDVPMVFMALRGDTTEQLKASSDCIILGGMKYWQVEREFRLNLPRLDHIDLLEANPSVRQSLKTLAARMHCRNLVDLPYDPHAALRLEQFNHVVAYCMHGDVEATHALFDQLREPLELRRQLSNIYKLDLRSRSDAQIGETIVKKRVEALTGQPVRKPQDVLAAGEHLFKYDVPAWVQFQHGHLQVVLESIRAAEFRVGAGGDVATPPALAGLQVRLGRMQYSMGIGGLHSTESNRAVLADAENVIIDVDVASQYPAILLGLGLYPKAVGPAFCQVYKALVDERLAAKAAGDKVRADGGKIAANGVYGKLGSPYSPLFAPNIMVAVTLTGQLSVLMFIEDCELAGIPAVSANTDGVTVLCPRAREAEFQAIVKAWEAKTGFAVEQARYRALYSASVNSYLAVKEDGKCKRKGPLADPWADGDLRGQLSKNPQMTACSHAVMKKAVDGTPLEETIAALQDPRMFVTAIKVNGGAQWRGNHLGRVVRYYWSTDGEPILYKDGGKKVSKTDGARPLMVLDGRLPADLDRGRYVAEAAKLAAELGMDAGLLK